MSSAFVSVLAVIALWGCAPTPVRIAAEGVRSKPLYYSDVLRYLESRVHSRVGSSISYQRDSVGSKLFITFFFRKGNDAAYRTLIVTRDGIREIPSYPSVCYDDLENPVFRVEGGREWYEDDGKSYRFFSRWDEANYIFKNGPAVPYKATSGVRGVLGGDLVLIQFPETTAWIASRPENPRQALLELPKNFEPDAAYASDGKLIIFATYTPPKGEQIDKCLIYQKAADGYRLSEEIPIPWGGTVYDMDVKTGDALITGKGQFAGYYRFNIRTKHRARLGFAPSNDVLYLKEDVIRKLDAAIRQSK